eukprot:scaffold17745_cov56-Isochrysis_galbana.AAC.1
MATRLLLFRKRLTQPTPADISGGAPAGNGGGAAADTAGGGAVDTGAGAAAGAGGCGEPPCSSTPPPRYPVGGIGAGASPALSDAAFTHAAWCGFTSADPLVTQWGEGLGGGGGARPSSAPPAQHPPKRQAPPPPASRLGGAQRFVTSDTELPFLLGASLPPSGILRAVETNLFSAPAFEHSLDPPGARLYLLVYDPTRRPDTAGGGSGRRTMALRRVGGLLLVGQQQPCEQQAGPQVVARPGTRDFRSLVERRIGVYLQSK